jgi:hypothetical protein
VLAVINTSSETGESRLDILNLDFNNGLGRSLLTQSYESYDNEHGASISSAAWTPNSRFFVYIMENGGGHSPLMHPIDFWDRNENSIHSLRATVGGFSVSAPDVVHAYRLDKELTETGEPFSVSLTSAAENDVENMVSSPSPKKSGPFGRPTVPDKKTAIAIAVAVCIPIWGKDAVTSQGPFHAQLTAGMWLVEGTPDKRGSVIRARISAVDGTIIGLSRAQ